MPNNYEKEKVRKPILSTLVRETLPENTEIVNYIKKTSSECTLSPERSKLLARFLALPANLIPERSELISRFLATLVTLRPEMS